MKRSYLWLLLAVAAGVALGYWLNRPSAKATPPMAPSAARPAPRPEVPIQDQKTIDFSSGQPVVKDSAQEKAIMASAVREINEAVKNVHFDPPATKPAEKKNPEPAEAVPPKK